MKSIFKNKRAEMDYYHHYDKMLEMVGLPYNSQYIQTSFGETHILTFGDLSKKPLVLLHGMTMSSTMWYPNIEQLMKERFVYAVDVMGDFGKSKPLTAIKTRKEAALWLLEVIDGLQLQATDLAGHSMGGFLALNFALAIPKRVSKLLLYAPVGSFYKVNPLFFVKIYPALLFRTEQLIDKAFLWFSGKNEPLHPIFRNQIIAGYRGAKPLLQVMPSVFLDKEFIDYTIPTLLLIGESEVIYPIHKVIEIAKRIIPNLELHTIQGANHSLTIEHAEIVNDHTLRFLANK